MTATYRAASAIVTQFSPAADPWSVTGPSGAASGDMIVLCLSFGDVAVGPDSFTGFTAGPTAEEGPNDGRGAMFYGSFASVGAGPYSIGFPGNTEGIAIALSLQGVDLVTPLNVASTALDDTVTDVTWTCTGQTTSVNGCCIVGVGGASPNNVGSVWAITAGTTQRQFSTLANDNFAIVVGTLDQTSAGLVTTSGTNTGTDTTWGLQMAFAPDGGGGGGPAGTTISQVIRPAIRWS